MTSLPAQTATKTTDRQKCWLSLRVKLWATTLTIKPWFSFLVVSLGTQKLKCMAMKVFLSLRKFRITLRPVWIYRDSEIIQWADSGSKDFRSDNNSIDPVFFQSLESKFGKFNVDCFATAPNVVCDKFFSSSCQVLRTLSKLNKT